MAYEWVGPALQVVSSLAGQYFQQKGSDKYRDEELAFREKELAQQLEIAKIQAARGGGGGRSKELDLLEMALGIYGDAASRKTQSLNAAADRYAGIYASIGK